MCSPPTPSVPGSGPAGGRRSSPGLGARGGRLDRLDPDALLGLGGVLELHLAGDRREHGVIVAEPGARSGQECHAALADDDRAGVDELAVAGLHAEALADAVATVLDAAACLLVGHLVYSSFFVVRVRFGAASASASGASAAAFAVLFFGAALLASGFASAAASVSPAVVASSSAVSSALAAFAFVGLASGAAW